MGVGRVVGGLRGGESAGEWRGWRGASSGGGGWSSLKS